MGLPFDLVPFTKRDVPEEARIYNHFPHEFRVRFYRASIACIGDNDIRQIYREFVSEYSKEISPFGTSPDGSIIDPERLHRDIIVNEDDEVVIDYIEYVINYIFSNMDSNQLLKINQRIRRIFREERVLFRMYPNEETLQSEIKSLTHRDTTSFEEPLTIEYIGNEPMIQADESVRVLGLDSKWSEAIDHYSTAWEYYQDGQFNSTIPEELAKAVESVAGAICKEDNNWVDSGAGLGTCLNEMKEQGLFEPNNELYPESEKIFTGLKISVQKSAGDKHRHEEVNQHYSILLLHQTAAFMTYVINRYEELF